MSTESRPLDALSHRPGSVSETSFGSDWVLSLTTSERTREALFPQFPERVGTSRLVASPRRWQLVFDYPQCYLVESANRQAQCRIRVYGPVDETLRSLSEAYPAQIEPISYRPTDPIVILCEPITIGAIANRAEQIATSVWHTLGRPLYVTWIEHWWKNHFPEFLCVQFSCVQGMLVDPWWTKVERSEVENLIGPVSEIHREHSSDPHARSRHVAKRKPSSRLECLYER